MIRGKAAVMFDPTKLLPQNQDGANKAIDARKAQANQSGDSTFSTAEGAPDLDKVGSVGVSNNDEQQFVHHSRPKAGGKRRARIIQPDNTYFEADVVIYQQDNIQRRQQSALELVQSERMYAMMLENFYHAFITPLLDNSSNYGISPTQAITLSQTLNEIILFSKDLTNNPQLGVDPQIVFKDQLQPLVDLYTLYISKSVHQIFGLLNDLLPNKRFRQHCRHVQSDLKLNLIESLLIPISRLASYELMIRKYASSCDLNGGDNAEIQLNKDLLQIADLFKEHTGPALDERISTAERSGRILSIQITLSITGSNVIYLWNPERHLVQEYVVLKSKINLQVPVEKSGQKLEPVVIANNAHGENKRKILLFNDQLLWTTDSPEMRYKGHVALTDINVQSYDLPDGDSLAPSLLVKQAKQETPKKQNEDSENHMVTREGWILVFDDTTKRDQWLREILSLQQQLTNVTTSSTLTIPIEVRDDKSNGCCTIL